MEYLILEDKGIADSKKERVKKKKFKKKEPREKRYLVIGGGEECGICGKIMERRKHKQKPKKSFHYTEWDCCRNASCNKTVQHYEKYKSASWQEAERQEQFFNNI